ncbi:phage tail protein [Streptomyces sp. NPDC001118]
MTGGVEYPRSRVGLALISPTVSITTGVKALAIGDALRTDIFAVDLGKFRVATYQQVSGLTFGQDATEVRTVTNSGELSTRKQPGAPQPQEIKLSRPMDASRQWVDWVQQCTEGGDTDSARQDIAITALDNNKKPTVRYNLTNAWASQWSGPDLDASSSEAATETVTITYEGITVE